MFGGDAMTRRLIFLLLLLVCAAVRAAEPDQVLVLYNADWREDLVGTEPGQDSLEVARPYQRMHTDPETGKKPYLLGLENLGPEDTYLHQVAPDETSRDNPWGLRYVGALPYTPDPTQPPRAVGAWGEMVEARHITSAGTHPDHALLVLPRRFLETIVPRSDKLVLTREGRPDVDLLRQKRSTTAVPMVRLPLPGGSLGVVVTLRGYARGKTTLTLHATNRETNKPITLKQGWDLADPGAPSGDKPELPNEAGFVDRLVSTESLRKLSRQMTFSGFVVSKADWQCIDPDTLTVAFSRDLERDRATVLVDRGRPAEGIGLDIYEMTKGDRMVHLSIRRELDLSRAYVIWLEARTPEDKPVVLRRDVHLSPREFAFDATGDDNRRDDQAYLDHIETPVKRFLEDPARRLPDGRLLKDHILYIVACYGLPHRVPSLYGVRRGEPNNGLRNLGRAGALTQRLQAMYLQPQGVHVVPFRIGRGRAPVIVSTPVVLIRSHVFNPYVLTSIFNPEARLDPSPPHFSTALRSGMPADRFLFGCTRIDAPTPQLAKRQIDSAVWASKHFTAKLGALRGSTSRTAPQAAGLARELGFEVPANWKDQPPRAERSAIVMGLFGYGPAYLEDIGSTPRGKSDTTAVHYLKGFKPGGWGYAVRSYLGWKREENPDQFGRYHEMMLRAGVALTCGATGGAHDTSHSRYPDRTVLHLLTHGYEYGDVLLKSSLYVNWVIDWYGDPLYRVDLEKTTVPEPIALADKSAVRPTLLPGGTALRVRAELGPGPATPRLAVMTARPAGEGTGKGDQSRSAPYETRPRGGAGGPGPSRGGQGPAGGHDLRGLLGPRPVGEHPLGAGPRGPTGGGGAEPAGAARDEDPSARQWSRLARHRCPCPRTGSRPARRRDRATRPRDGPGPAAQPTLATGSRAASGSGSSSRIRSVHSGTIVRSVAGEIPAASRRRTTSVRWWRGASGRVRSSGAVMVRTCCSRIRSMPCLRARSSPAEPPAGLCEVSARR